IAADRDANGGVDVARRKPVARGTGAVDVDLDRRLAERGEDGEVGDARHRRQHRLDLGGGVRQGLQAVAVVLDRILALHARLHFRKFTDDVADAVDVGVAFIERYRGRQRRTYPEVALFKLWQKLQAQ